VPDEFLLVSLNINRDKAAWSEKISAWSGSSFFIIFAVMTDSRK